MRLFELTINVYAPDYEMPVGFRDWIDLAFGTEGMEIGASSTTLEKVRELRYPLADDILWRRRGSSRVIY